MWARISAFVIWSLVAATAAFWLLRLATSAPQAPAYAVAVGKSPVARGDLARLFGAAPAAVAAVEAVPEAPSRFKLVGVMAPRAKEAQTVAGSGVALIAVDGKPPKTFTVGSSVEGGLVLQSVGLRTASIGPAQGARSMLLELPALVPPATGVLPSGAGGFAPPPAMAGSPVPANNAAPQFGPQGVQPFPGGGRGASPGVPVLPGNAPLFQPPQQQLQQQPQQGPSIVPSPSTTMPSNMNDVVRSQ
jgi:general secretion pathway protein C